MKQMNETFPVLYVIMRNDMASLGPGRGMAQSNHAASVFHERIHGGEVRSDSPVGQLFSRWKSATRQKFGTCIVLQANEDAMRQAVRIAEALGFFAEVVNDPEYAVLDGDTVHMVSIDTCAYIFCDKNNPLVRAAVGTLSLVPNVWEKRS